MGTEARPGYEHAPWNDDMGFLYRQNEAMRIDPNTGDELWKDSTVRVTVGGLRDIRLAYNITVTRSDDAIITTFIEYVDELGEPVRIILPGKVTERVEQLADRLRAENRSRKSSEAAYERGLGRKPKSD